MAGNILCHICQGDEPIGQILVGGVIADVG